MLEPEEELIRFPFHRAINSFKYEDYDPKLTNNRLSPDKVEKIFQKINKIIHSTQHEEKSLNKTLNVLKIIWILLGFAILIAFKRNLAASKNSSLSLLEINSYMILVFASLLINFSTIRALNKLTDKNFRLIQKLLMEKNQAFMKNGYRWNILLPSEMLLDLVPPKRVYFKALELCKDYWSIDDFGFIDEERQDVINFPFNQRKNQFIYQFYTPKLTNYRLSLKDLTEFFSTMERTLKPNSQVSQFLLAYIEASWTVIIGFAIEIFILALLGSKNDYRGFEFKCLFALSIFYCLTLRISAIILNFKARKNHQKIQETLETKNISFRRDNGMSWRTGDLTKEWKDPFTGSLLVYTNVQLSKDYKNGDHVFSSDGYYDDKYSPGKNNRSKVDLNASSGMLLV